MTSFAVLSSPRRSEPRSEAAAELAHHQFDLRVHAAIMLFNAALAIYCIFSICEPDTSDSPVDIAAAAAGGGLASLCAVIVFAVIAFLCVLGASRCWLKASHTAASHRTGRATEKATERLKPIWRRGLAWFAAAARHRTRLAGVE